MNNSAAVIPNFTVACDVRHANNSVSEYCCIGFYLPQGGYVFIVVCFFSNFAQTLPNGCT